MSDSFFTQISRVEAAHQLTQSFEREMDNVEMAKFYKKAWKWHKQEAARYKHLLSKVASRLIDDSDDEHQLPIPLGVSQEMKQMLQDKRDKL